MTTALISEDLEGFKRNWEFIRTPIAEYSILPTCFYSLVTINLLPVLKYPWKHLENTWKKEFTTELLSTIF